MAIEWVPRSAPAPGHPRAWNVVEGSPDVAVPTSIEVDGGRAVRVPVRRPPRTRRQRVGVGRWVLLIVLFNLTKLLGDAGRFLGGLWAALTLSAWWPLSSATASSGCDP